MKTNVSNCLFDLGVKGQGLTTLIFRIFILPEVCRSITIKRFIPGELRLSGNHTVTEYEMSGEPYSEKSGWINIQLSEFSR